MTSRLKVFTWSDGFHAFTVATSSRPKALAAWGSRQDLFATGLASQVTEGEDFEAALAAPGQVVERDLMIRPSKIDKARARSESASSSSLKARREKIVRLERKLAQLDEEYQANSATCDEDARRVEQRRVELDQDHQHRHKALMAKLTTARR